MSEQRAPGLTVISVLYRSRDTLVETLPTWVRSARGLPVRFSFTDNRPADGCAEVIAGLLGPDRYDYLADDANPGFALACNRAVAASSTTHVLLLNPDVWLDEDSLTRIWTAARHRDRPIAVGLQVRDRHHVGVDLNPVGLFIDRRATARRGPLGPSGGAAVFPAALFLRFGGFCASFFAWGEDADLAFRLYAAGLRTDTLELALPHLSGHSVDGATDLLRRRAFLLARNRLLVAARVFSGPLLLLILPIMVIAHGGLAVRRARRGQLRPFLRGVGRGLIEGPAARRQWRGARFDLADLLGYLRTRSAG